MTEAVRVLDAGASRVLDYLITRLPRVVAGRPETYPTYKQVHDALGLEMMGSTYGESLKVQGLESLANWSVAHGLPAVTGLVVESEARMPARGFFRVHDRPEDDFAWWTAEIVKCKETDWVAVLAETVSKSTAQHLSHRDPRLSLDAEFENFLAGFLRREAGHWLDWLPGYTDAVESIRASIQSGNLADATELIWRPQDNGVANAGPGVLASKTVDGAFEELKQITAAIASDQSAESYLRVSRRVRDLKDQGKLPKYPALLIARAFDR